MRVLSLGLASTIPADIGKCLSPTASLNLMTDGSALSIIPISAGYLRIGANGRSPTESDRVTGFEKRRCVNKVRMQRKVEH